MRSIGIRLGIIGAILIGGFLVRQFVMGNAGDLSVGDCFDAPAGVEDTVEDVQHHPCTDAHTAEVFYVGKFEPSTSTYPTDAEFATYLEAQCAPAFNTYTGLDFATDTTYDIGWFQPTQEGWGSGDRGISCWAVRLDDAPMNQSVKKT